MQRSNRNDARRRHLWVVILSRLACIAPVCAPALGGCRSDLERQFQAHIDYLASDKLEGRGVGSRGIELAANYIAGQFKAIGLEPAGENGTYFQTFSMTLHRNLMDACRLSFSDGTVGRRQGRDYIPFNFSSDGTFGGPAVFCGYGIVNPDKSYDDFEDLELTGKVALMFDGEPPSWADENGNPTPHAMLRNKVYNAKDRGAVAVIITNPKPESGEEDHLPEFVSEGTDEYGVPAFHVTREMAEAAVSAGGLGSLEELQKKLDAGTEASAELGHIQANGQARFETKRAPTKNVLGKLRGRGPLAEEFIVIGAHYDHLGIRKPMMRKFKAGKVVADVRGPQIHNGADDNASGISGLIEIARMFAADPPPRRSVLFIAFTAEESGLHGSKRYVEQPPVRLDHTVAMLNMDMIGRLKRGARSNEPAGMHSNDAPVGLQPSDGRLQVFGAGTGTGLTEALDHAAAVVGVPVVRGVDEGGRSDHASFLRKQIPSLHFFSGTHSDYHQPSDDSQKINTQDGAKIAALVYHVGRELATREERPVFQVVREKQKREPSAGSSTFRVVMGLTPNYADDGTPGMGVDAVSPEGPADVAGMKAGDRIIRVNGKSVANVYDYMASTRNNKPGDRVEVVVLREGKEHTLEVTLSAAR